MAGKKLPRLENWYIWVIGMGEEFRLTGDVYNHPVERHYDGKGITTSILQSIDCIKDIAQTRSREYILGEPDKHWLANILSLGFASLDDYCKKELGL